MFSEFLFLSLAESTTNLMDSKKCRFIPQYFEKDISSGIPVLTSAGRKAVEEELKECSETWPSS